LGVVVVIFFARCFVIFDLLLLGVTLVVTVVVAVDFAPLVTIVFVVALAPDDDIAFVVCASAGVASSATPASDPINAFMAFSPLQRWPAPAR
jgi:hypothetical protein